MTKLTFTKTAIVERRVRVAPRPTTPAPVRISGTLGIRL